MNAILKFLYQYNILEIDKKDVKKWLEKEQFDYLKYGIKEGAYDIRLLCLKAYISLNT